MKKIISFIAAIFLLASSHAQKERIVLQLTRGATYRHTTQSTSTIAQTINGQSLDMHMSISGTIAYTVTDISDSLYTMNTVYESLSLKMGLPDGTQEFSSGKNDKTDIASTLLGSLTGKVFTVRMSKAGKIISIENIESLFSHMFDSLPQVPDAQKQQMKNQMMQTYGEKAFKGNMEMVTAVFPAAEVAKGDKWTVDTKLESGMVADIQTTYELKEINENYYLIAGNSVIKTEDNGSYTEANGMSVKYNLTGAMTSAIKLDKTSGWFVTAAIDQHISGNIKIKDSPETPGGMSIPMSIKSEIAITN